MEKHEWAKMGIPPFPIHAPPRPLFLVHSHRPLGIRFVSPGCRRLVIHPSISSASVCSVQLTTIKESEVPLPKLPTIFHHPATQVFSKSISSTMRLFALLTILPAALALPTDPFVENLGRITPMEMLLIRIGLKDPIMPQCASKFSTSCLIFSFPPHPSLFSPPFPLTAEARKTNQDGIRTTADSNRSVP